MNKNKSKCASVKNPCKYCLTQVTNRNGLQCQGACKKWAHFECLNYTPGKISDIKAGIIKVMCPCPDCETSQDKEFLTRPPYTCSNHKCPGNATGPPKCDSNECPSNKNKQIEKECSNKTCIDDAVECPSPPRPTPRKVPRSTPIPKTCMTPERKPVNKPRKRKLAVTYSNSNSNSSCEEPQPCPDPNIIICGEEEDEDSQDAMVEALQEMCGTVGKLSKQIKELMCKINKMT